MNDSSHMLLRPCGPVGRLAVVCLLWFAHDSGLVQGASSSSREAEEKLALPSDSHRLCLSLRALSKQVSAARAGGSALSDDLRNLCGIGYLEGFIVDESGEKDIILVGRRSPGRPFLHLDDLIVNMRNVGLSQPHPSCSLDPRKEDVRALDALLASERNLQSLEDMAAFFQKVAATIGPQEIVVGGVPRNSRHAHVMIDADYHMKKVSQGHVQVPGVVSCLDMSLEEIKQAISSGVAQTGEQGSMSRFWFHIDPCKPDEPGYEATEYPIFQEAKGIVWLEGCPVVLLTEKQASTASGELHDVKEDDPTAMAFAAQLSREFTNLTGHVPVYADLENLYRLHAIVLAIKHHASLETVGWSLETYLSDYECQEESPMGDSLPGLANRREWSCKITKPEGVYEYCASPLVCGGVQQEMTVKQDSFSDRNNSWLFGLKMTALFAKPTKDSLVWEVPTSKKASRLFPVPFRTYGMPGAVYAVQERSLFAVANPDGCL